MKILIVGGGGVIGGTAALHFRGQGHDVTIAGRNPPRPEVLKDFPFERVDYIANDTPASVLGKFETVVFAAGNDSRHQPKDSGPDYWKRVNSEAVPRFFASLKDAGVATAINVGSYYPQAAPRLIANNLYIQSRLAADDGIRALSSPSFKAVSVNAPVVLGSLSGELSAMLRVGVRYAEGRLEIPVFAPPGGTNFISTTSLTQAIQGAILRGAGGTAYLVGDENWSYQQYFGAFFEAVGKPLPPIIDREHPLFPDAVQYGGRGDVIAYETPADETALLGYKRHDIRRVIQEAVVTYSGQ